MVYFILDTVIIENVEEVDEESGYCSTIGNFFRRKAEPMHYTTIVRKLLEEATNGNKIVKKELDQQLSMDN